MQIKRRRQPVGFTLIEMLIVIGVITLLMAALVPLVGNMITSARVSATQATIKVVSEALASRMEAFDRAFEPSKKNKFKSQIDILMLSGISQEVAQIYVRKQQFREYFPQRFEESGYIGSSDLPYSPTDSNPSLSGMQDPTESAECLYYIIFEGKAVDEEPEDVDLLKRSVADTDGDGRLEFVDAWGKPLRFYRWPTRLVRPGNANSSADTSVSPIDAITDYMLPGISDEMLLEDSDDKLNRLHLVAPWNGSQADFEYNTTSPSNSFHTVGTFNRFLIVSSGPDEILGLYEPSDVANFGHLARPTEEALNFTGGPMNSNLNDDINNRQRQGGN